MEILKFFKSLNRSTGLSPGSCLGFGFRVLQKPSHTLLFLVDDCVLVTLYSCLDEMIKKIRFNLAFYFVPITEFHWQKKLYDGMLPSICENHLTFSFLLYSPFNMSLQFR